MRLRTLASVVVAVLVAAILFAVPASAQASSTAQTSSVEGLQPVTSEAGFTHPGIFVSLEDLETSRAHVRAGDAPWRTIFDDLKSSDAATRGAPDFSAFASAKTGERSCSASDPGGCISYCGPYSKPNVGCTDELADAKAVYAQALMFWYTGDKAYAGRAIDILNAYAQHFKGHDGSNGPLMAAWTMQMMLRGAELLRYTYVPDKGETRFDVTGFSTMLRAVYVDRLTTFDWYRVPSNWMGSAAEGMMNAAIFLDDRKLYDQAVAMWRDYVPNYIYVSSDGDFPHALDVSPIHRVGAIGTETAQERTNLKCFWLFNKAKGCERSPMQDPGPLQFQDGQTQETCRDMNHTSMGLGSMVNAAETAWIQGDDLYGEERQRIMTALSYATQISQSYGSDGWPTKFCNDIPDLGGSLSLDSISADVAYNHYTVREGVKFTTLKVPGYDKTYPSGDPVAAFVALRRTDANPSTAVSAWESLTHHRIADGYTPPPAPNVNPPRTADKVTPPGDAMKPKVDAAADVGMTLPTGAGAVVLSLGVAAIIAVGIFAIKTSRRRQRGL